jgi:MYXO-CTERM domain-containing protein
VCCETACLGKCQACNAANKESGTASGDCEAAKKGTNPGNLCIKSATDDCGEQASCSGIEGVCAVAAFGTSCGPTVCNGTSVSGKICDGTGTCIDQTNANCFPYVCQGGACTSPCAQDVECDSQYYCQGGFCVPKLDNGLGCNAANQCKSSFCVDGVCCDSPCTGQCEACAESGKVGQCLPVTGKPRDPRPDCTGTGACKGQCDGANPTTCAWPAAAVECAPASCTGDTLQPAGTCDGNGGCSIPTTSNCVPYACDTAVGSCKATCVSDGDCAQGSKCDTTTGKCAVTSATCKDEHTVLLPNGQEQSCEPYKCVGGACQQQCSTSDDCAAGYECQGNQCVSESDAGSGGSAGTAGSAGSAGSAAGASGASGDGGGSADDGGCGCRVPAAPAQNPATLVLLALAALARRRRR